MPRPVAVRNAERVHTELARGGPGLACLESRCLARHCGRRRAAEVPMSRSSGLTSESTAVENGRPGRLQSYSYSHSSVRRADGSVSGQTMGEYVDHAGRKKHSRERRVGDTRMLETTDERPGADRPMQSRELHNGDRAEAFDGVGAACR